jgi:hypothetical protein
MYQSCESQHSTHGHKQYTSTGKPEISSFVQTICKRKESATPPRRGTILRLQIVTCAKTELMRAKYFSAATYFFRLQMVTCAKTKIMRATHFSAATYFLPPPSFPFSSIRLAIKYVHGTTRYTSNYFVCARVCVCVHARCCVYTNATSSAVLQDYSLSQTRIHLHSE